MLLTKTAIITFSLVCGIWDIEEKKCLMHNCMVQVYDKENPDRLLEEYPVQTRICESINQYNKE